MSETEALTRAAYRCVTASILRDATPRDTGEGDVVSDASVSGPPLSLLVIWFSDR